MNKRELVLSFLDPDEPQKYTPAAFFLHFDPIYRRGQAAIDKHMEFFQYTDMDFVKIQYETLFPNRPQMQRPQDWVNMPLYLEDFYADQLRIVESLIKQASKEALVIMTLYSPFMCARFTNDKITEHIKENPAQAKKGLEIITESLMLFVKACVRLGIDGFYHSTQGGESFRCDDIALFEESIKPFDLVLMEEINHSCIFNILHVCDFRGQYTDLQPFLDYPGHVVSSGLDLTAATLSTQEVFDLFGRPFMGGMDRNGILVSGDSAEIKRAVEDVLDNAPPKFILGADCTLPADVSWDNIKTAISAAHRYPR